MKHSNLLINYRLELSLLLFLGACQLQSDLEKDRLILDTASESADQLAGRGNSPNSLLLFWIVEIGAGVATRHSGSITSSQFRSALRKGSIAIKATSYHFRSNLFIFATL